MLDVGEFDKGGSLGYGLWAGWFVHKRHAHRQGVCYLHESARSGKAVSPQVHKFSKMVKHQKIQKIKKVIHTGTSFLLSFKEIFKNLATQVSLLVIKYMLYKKKVGKKITKIATTGEHLLCPAIGEMLKIPVHLN